MVTPVIDRPHETIRDGLGFGDHLGLAHLLLGHAEQCQQLPVAFAENRSLFTPIVMRAHEP